MSGIGLTINPQYLAGVMDSDGSFTITRRHPQRQKQCNYTCMVQLTWTLNEKTKKFIESLAAQYGGSWFIGSPKNNYINSKPIIKYCGTGEAAKSIAEDTKNYLRLKKEQADNIIEVRRLISTFRGSRPIDISEALSSLYSLNKQLNSKNGKSNV